MTKEQILENHGVDWGVFQWENEYTARNILNAMEEYARSKAENLPISVVSKCTCKYDCDNCGAKGVKPISMGNECCPECFC